MLTIPPTHQSSSGFTLTELLIALVVIGLMLAVGAPSLTEWMQNSQIRTASESMLNGLQAARSEALRRNTNVEFILVNPGGEGNTGWQLRVVNTGQILQDKPAGEGSARVTIATTPANANIYTYNGLGRSMGAMNMDGTPALTQIDISSGAAVLSTGAWRNLRILIGTGGNTKLCDPAVVNAQDPRSCN